MFTLENNGVVIQPGLQTVEPGEITGRVWPIDTWRDPVAIAQSPVGADLHVFKTPIKDRKPWRDELRERDGEVVYLGEIPSLVVTAASFAIKAEVGNWYDVLFAARRQDGTGAAYNYSPLLVKKDVGTQPLDPKLTLDELRCIACVGLGVSVERAKTIRAGVVSVLANDGELIVAGFNLNLRSKGRNTQTGVVVNGDGAYQRFRHLTAAETLQQARVHK